jgi:hypothetical protein
MTDFRPGSMPALALKLIWNSDIHESAHYDLNSVSFTIGFNFGSYIAELSNS